MTATHSATVIPEIEAQIGANLSRIVADRGYRGHNAPPDHKFRVYISGQKRRVTAAIKRDLRRRSAVEPVHRPSQDPSTAWAATTSPHAAGDAANAVLAAAGYNFRRLLAWLADPFARLHHGRARRRPGTYDPRADRRRLTLIKIAPAPANVAYDPT